jgi:hypothetical protein
MHKKIAAQNKKDHENHGPGDFLPMGSKKGMRCCVLATACVCNAPHPPD